ncbi:MAG: thioredoxin family protein [Planctomycetota bacterium]
MRVATLLLASILASMAVAPASAQLAPTARNVSRQTPVFRHANVDLAWQAAQKTGRPVMVFVTSADCFFCKKMMSETLSNPRIAQANNRRFETTVLSKETQPELVEKLGVKAFPTTLIVNTDGTLQNQVRGFVEPAKYVQQVFVGPRQTRQAARPQASDAAGDRSPR